MDLVADAVAGPGEPDAVLFCDGLDIAVVIGVFKAGLQRVVVDVGDAALCLDPGHTHGFEFQVRHRAGGVLCQCLVDFQGDLAARRHFAGAQMRFDDFLCDRVTHYACSFPRILAFALVMCSTVSALARSASPAAMASKMARCSCVAARARAVSAMELRR